MKCTVQVKGRVRSVPLQNLQNRGSSSSSQPTQSRTEECSFLKCLSLSGRLLYSRENTERFVELIQIRPRQLLLEEPNKINVSLLVGAAYKRFKLGHMITCWCKENVWSLYGGSISTWTGKGTKCSRIELSRGAQGHFGLYLLTISEDWVLQGCLLLSKVEFNVGNFELFL